MAGAVRRVAVLGSTGSIGTQAFDVMARHASRFDVVSLAAGGSRVGLLAEQVASVRPSFVGVACDVRDELRAAVTSLTGGWCPEIACGQGAVAEAAAVDCDVVLNGVDGAVGISASLAALRSGATLALANKESLVMGGDVVIEAAGGPAAVRERIVPVDSEHSALAQCLMAGQRREVRRLVVTASGGPFRGKKRDELHDVTPEQAMAHPTWTMGTSVTINSATMVNKALEVIEAHLLFGVPYSEIDVVVHPQSVVHSMVEFMDGCTMAQCSPPDMRLPIALGLAWPERLADVSPSCDWTQATSWEFFPVDEVTFPATKLAKQVGVLGGTFPAVFNAANEALLPEFIDGRLPFLGIVDCIAAVVDAHDGHELSRRRGQAAMTLEDVVVADQWARRAAREMMVVN